jgi:hypothetical protein
MARGMLKEKRAQDPRDHVYARRLGESLNMAMASEFLSKRPMAPRAKGSVEGSS